MMKAQATSRRGLSFILQGAFRVFTPAVTWLIAFGGAANGEELRGMEFSALEGGQTSLGASTLLADDSKPGVELATPALGLIELPGAPKHPADFAPVGQDKNGHERISVLVHLDPDFDTAQVAAAPRGLVLSNPCRSSIRGFAGRCGAKVWHEYDILPNVINIREIPREDIAALERMPGVLKVEEDEMVRISLHDSIPLIRGLQSQIQGAGLTADGTGARVCIVNTGIDSDHQMFAGRIDTAAGFDYVNFDANPEDDQGHGTHVAGIAAGRDGSTVNFGCVGAEPFQGVAPEARIIAIKVCDEFGGCFVSDIVAGINRCASSSLPGGRADVINLSLGGGQFSGTCDGDTMAQAANSAVNAGVVVVAAAGNNGFSNSLVSPACGTRVIAVGATYDDSYPSCEFPSQTSFSYCLAYGPFGDCTQNCVDSAPTAAQRACFSNRSVNLDVTAPGCLIHSADEAAGGTSILGRCGTSMASPHVAGLAALIVSVNTTLTPAEVGQVIRDGATDLGTPGFDSNFGYGRIDVIRSLQLLGPGCFTDGDCNDGIACTADSCHPGTQQCVHTPNNAACNDGSFCNGAETCDPGSGCRAGPAPCSGGNCDEAADECLSVGAEVWMSFKDTALIPGVGTIENEDIVARNTATGTWSLVFDGSDVGLAGLAIDGLAVLPSGNLLLSFTNYGLIPGMTGGPYGTALDDSDIVRFIPTSLGATTVGSFVFYFDGSDVDLLTIDEDIDAIDVTLDGRLILSTIGNFAALGVTGTDTDLLVFTPSSLGAVTSGTYAIYFDGSDVSLTDSSSEDVDAVAVTSTGSLLLSTLGAVAVPGVSAGNEDILQLVPTQLGPTTSGVYSLYLDLSALGVDASEDLMALELVE